ncbi:hypothetical protein TNCV_1332311 [Trichonephila clavipes]|nr:hypothetical protein TNCV_1332311 [Trichonephila clavipes]
MLSSRPGVIYQQDNARPTEVAAARRLFDQQCLQGYDVLPWPARSPDLYANRACLERAGKATAAVRRDTGELTAQMQRLWQDLPQGCHK